MTVRLIAFTDRGEALAARLAAALKGQSQRCNQPLRLAEWTRQAFESADALVFVGAAGIAVRAIAPFVRSKTTDPAVVVVDEQGTFAVPILSGHLGGANDLALEIAGILGAVPVITTATDRGDIFAVDLWARRQGCAVVNPEKIKEVSARLLSGGTIKLRSDWSIQGQAPQGILLTQEEDCDVRLTLDSGGNDALCIVPKILVLGVGCKKGTPQVAIEQAFAALGVQAQAVTAVCTIDLKAQEPGLLAFCRSHGLPLRTFSAQELGAVAGDFTASEFVLRTTGVDNVCERSAVLGSGGTLFRKKTAGNGVTMALARKPFAPDWSWKYV